MRYAFKQFVINPIEPVKQAGHIQQVDPVSEVHDDLHARCHVKCAPQKIHGDVNLSIAVFVDFYWLHPCCWKIPSCVVGLHSYFYFSIHLIIL